MVSAFTIGSIVINIFKLVVNIAVLYLYRMGDGGHFLGIGGTWNLNEEKNIDAEIVASGVFVGFIIYTVAQLVSQIFRRTAHKRELSNAIMNFVGTVLWVSVGGLTLHYWNGYTSAYNRRFYPTEQKCGLAVGYLSLTSSALYLLDTILACFHSAKNQN